MMSGEQLSTDKLKELGNKAFSANNYEDAIKHFTDAIALDDANHVFFSNRSAAYAKLSNFQAALEDAEKTTTIKPDWAKGYSRKGAALHGLNKLDEAAEAYKQGLTIDPNNAVLKSGLESVESAKMASAGNPIANLFGPDIFAKIASNPKLSPMLSNKDFCDKVKAIQANPQTMNMYMQDPNLIVELLGIGGMQQPSNPSNESNATPEPPKPQPKKDEPVAKQPEPELSPEEQEKKDKRDASNKEKDLGNQNYKKRSFEVALGHYAKAFELDKTNVAVLTNKSAVLFEMENYDECISACEEAVEIGREIFADFKLIARAYSRMGAAYAKNGDLDSAIKYAQKSLSEFRTPDALEKLREFEKAKKLMDEEAYHDPKLSDEAREKGNECFKSANFVEGVKHYTEAIKRNKKEPRNFSNRAACYTKLMAFPEADKDCDEAIKLDEHFVKAYIRKAAIMFAKKDYKKCMDVCNEALSKDLEKKHTKEIEGQIQRCQFAIHGGQSNESKEETLKRAMDDPEVQQILADPVMRSILEQMQNDPQAARDHMKNPAVTAKLQTLINAGVLRMQ